MTEEHKKRISDSCKGITKNNGKIWITNGEQLTRIFPEELDTYTKRGFVRGKKLNKKEYVPWNKGLTKEDPRVQQYIQNRRK